MPFVPDVKTSSFVPDAPVSSFVPDAPVAPQSNMFVPTIGTNIPRTSEELGIKNLQGLQSQGMQTFGGASTVGAPIPDLIRIGGSAPSFLANDKESLLFNTGPLTDEEGRRAAPIAAGIGQGAANWLSGLTEPMNAGLAVASAGLPTSLARVASTGFAASMAPTAGQLAGELSVPDQGRSSADTAQKSADLVGTLAMMYMAAKHGATPEPALAESLAKKLNESQLAGGQPYSPNVQRANVPATPLDAVAMQPPKVLEEPLPPNAAQVERDNQRAMLQRATGPLAEPPVIIPSIETPNTPSKSIGVNPSILDNQREQDWRTLLNVQARDPKFNIPNGINELSSNPTESLQNNSSAPIPNSLQQAFDRVPGLSDFLIKIVEGNKPLRTQEEVVSDKLPPLEPLPPEQGPVKIEPTDRALTTSQILNKQSIPKKETVMPPVEGELLNPPKLITQEPRKILDNPVKQEPVETVAKSPAFRPLFDEPDSTKNAPGEHNPSTKALTAKQIAAKGISLYGSEAVDALAKHLESLKTDKTSQSGHMNAFGPLPAAWNALVSSAKAVLPPSLHAGLTALDKVKTGIGTVKDYMDNRDRIAFRNDAANNEARNTGNQAGNWLRAMSVKDFGKDAEIARNAAVAVVESGFDRNNLAAFKTKAASSDMGKAAIDYAEANWDKLQPLAKHAKLLTDVNRGIELMNGVKTDYVNNYVKHAYDIDKGNMFDQFVNPTGGTGGTRSHKQERVFDTYFDAMEAGYKPKTMDIAKLTESRITAGRQEVNQRKWIDEFKQVADPRDKKPIIADAGSGRGYKDVNIAGIPVGVHEGYTDLFKALTGESAIRNTPVGKAALNLVGAVKHGTFLFDIFHASRITQMREAYGLSAKPYQNGLSLLEYSEPALKEAIAAKTMPAEALQYANEPVTTPQGTLNRRAIATKLNANGLNAGQVSDALYTNWIKDMKIVGPTNKFIFQKLTRGAMMEAAQNEYERVGNNHSTWTQDQVARKVAKDLNFKFGNIGKQGLFKNATFQDMSRLAFNAPQWFESRANNDIRAIAQGAQALNPMSEHFLKLGTIAKGSRNLLAMYLVATQALNYATTGKFTWENDDKNHKLDAYVPPIKKDDRGLYVSPFGVEGELVHSMMKYSRLNGGSYTRAIGQIVNNRLSPLSHGKDILLDGTDGFSKSGSDWESIKNAALTMANPLPLPVRAVASAIKEGQPSTALQQGATFLGVKADKESPSEVRDRATRGKSAEDRIDIQNEMKAAQKPKSDEDKVAAAAAGERAMQDRIKAVTKGLSESSQALLTKHELTLPSYQDKVRIRKGEELNLNSKEQAQLKEKLIEGYDEVIRGFSDKDFVGLSKGEKQQMLNRELHRVSKQAEKEVKDSID